MARRSCALIGPGKGPQVRVSGTSAKVQIRGLGEDERVFVVQQLDEHADLVLMVKDNGDHELADCNYVSVEYKGSNRGFIACVLIGG